MKPFAKRIIFQASRVTLVVVTVSLAVQTYLAGWKKPEPVAVKPHAETHETPSTQTTSTQTLWAQIKQNENLSRFAKLVGEFEDIVGGLQAPPAQLTVYAPVNEAFEKEDFPYDLPWFYWKFLVGYHMGKGAVSAQALHSQNTVSSFVNADIFFKNQQRISVQNNADGVTFNFRAKLLASHPAKNGHLHVVDRLLTLPDSTADVLRYTPAFGIFRQGLIDTGLAEIINDTSTHTAQTVFAPSDVAFRKLGPKALLAYHIVSNETLFSDVYFPTKNGKQVVLDLQSTSNQISLPTLAQGHTILASSVRQSSDDRRTILINDEWEVSRPDIVVMDGVVHEMDAVILPPVLEAEGQSGKNGHWWSIVSRSLHIRGEITVGELMERLQPLIDIET
ncbi:unnamed protein product [Penicillium bialowiezense]